MKRYILYQLELECSEPSIGFYDYTCGDYMEYSSQREFVEDVYHTIFGIYKTEESAIKAKDNLKLKHWQIDEIDWED